MSQNYTDLRCLLDIKMLAQQANGAQALAAYPLHSNEHLIMRNAEV